MVGSIFGALRWLHIAAGSLGLILFWGPVFARKGGRAHISMGSVYLGVMAVVVFTGLGLSALMFTNPLAIRLPGADPPRPKPWPATSTWSVFSPSSSPTWSWSS